MPHHLGDVDTLARTAVVTGDPDRVPRLAAAAGAVRHTWSRRGYVGVEVDACGGTVIVCSTGIGGPSAAIVIEELAELGVRQLVRVGTCGSLQPDVIAGDLVISSGSVRDEGTGAQYLPPEFPAVPDHYLVSEILAAVQHTGHAYHLGITHSKDAYYAEAAAQMPFAQEWRARWEALRAAGVLATEMEAAALFVVAAARRLRAAAVLVPVDDTLSVEATLASLEVATRAAVAGALALEAARTAAGLA